MIGEFLYFIGESWFPVHHVWGWVRPKSV